MALTRRRFVLSQGRLRISHGQLSLSRPLGQSIPWLDTLYLSVVLVPPAVSTGHPIDGLARPVPRSFHPALRPILSRRPCLSVSSSAIHVIGSPDESHFAAGDDPRCPRGA